MLKRKTLVIFFIALTLFVAGAFAVGNGWMRADAATSVSSLEARQKKLKAQISALEAQITQSKKDKSNALEQQSLLSKQITAYQEDIENTNELISAYEKQISDLKQLLSQNEANYDKLYEELKDRIRIMYENGTISYLDVLLTSKDISDLITRADIINSLVNSDKKKLSDLLDARAAIASSKEDLETIKFSLEEQKSSLVAKKNTLQRKQNEVDKLLAELSKEVESNKEALLELEKEEARVAKEIAEAAKAASSSKKYVGGAFAWPLPGYYYISSPFGMRTHPITHVYKLHTGIDIGRVPYGMTIQSANAGTVIRSTYSTAYGNYVMVDHGGGKVTLYAHMSKRSVSKGDTVTKGQKLGEVGSTGYSTATHLHFEIIINGEHVNPLNYFTLS